MKPIVLLPLGLLLCVAASAPAEPAWGRNCLSCHSQLLTNTLYIFGEDTIADPDESQTGAPDRGPLPVFQTLRGNTKSLYAEVAGLETDDRYAVELARLRYAGVETGGQLSYTGDCSWPEWGQNARYYTNPVIAHSWETDPTIFTFGIDVEPDATYDYYDLVFAVAGKSAASGELFYAEQHFYLRVYVLRGDLNCDGVINTFDIDAFVLALTDPAGYASAYRACDIMAGDVNEDGHIDTFDIDAFVALLTGG